MMFLKHLIQVQKGDSRATKFALFNTKQEVSKAHIPPAVAIRGCNTFREKTKMVKDFIILNQVVSEKTLMKNVHMCYIRATEGKIEKMKKKRQNED